MKKIAVILMVSIYAMSICGISVNRFYCCGALKSTGISTAIFSKQNKADDGCCRHTQTILKVSDSHENASLAEVTKINTGYFVCDVFAPDANNNLSRCYLTSGKNIINGPPVQSPVTPLYIQLCTYRI
jgi:hypothetical protein